MIDHEHGLSTLNRRAFLGRTSIGLGSIALASLLDPKLLAGSPEIDAFPVSWRSHGVIDKFQVRPRVKLLPIFPVGRSADGALPPDAAEIDGLDLDRLPCADSRAVTADGIYACPILAGLPEARLGARTLDAALGPVALAHAACRVCVETGASCRNG